MNLMKFFKQLMRADTSQSNVSVHSHVVVMACEGQPLPTEGCASLCYWSNWDMS